MEMRPFQKKTGAASIIQPYFRPMQQGVRVVYSFAASWGTLLQRKRRLHRELPHLIILRLNSNATGTGRKRIYCGLLSKKSQELFTHTHTHFFNPNQWTASARCSVAKVMLN